MKKSLCRILVSLITASMIIGMLSVYAFADEEVAEAPVTTEETSVESTEEVTEAPVISEETQLVLDSLEDGTEYVEGELIVVYEEEEPSLFSGLFSSESTEVASITEENGIVSAEPIGDTGAVLVQLDKNEDMGEKIIELSEREDVAFVQPNYIYTSTDTVDYAFLESLISEGNVSTNDPKLYLQPYLDQVYIADAWTKVLAMDYSTVRVAVLDSGINLAHEDLNGALLTEYCRDVTKDKVNDEYVLCTTDSSGHGSNVASIIGAVSNNGKGMAGAATCGLGTQTPLEIFAVKVLSGSSGTTVDVAEGVNYAVESGAKIINMSLGYEDNSAEWADWVFKQAIDNAYDQGVICVAAAGNSNTGKYHYPSDYEKVIAVTALDTIYTADISPKAFCDFTKASFSNYNECKDIAAPGVYIMGAYNSGTNSYAYMSGTSQATPIVSAVIALMCMVKPDLTFDQVLGIITTYARDITSTGIGPDIYTGAGLIDADACISSLTRIDYSFDEETGNLSIYGAGDMTDYSEDNLPPWDSYKSDILSVTFNNWITSIGNNAFYECENLQSVILLSCTSAIGTNAFAGCSALTDVYYYGSEQQRSGISIATGNSSLNSATWHYNFCVHRTEHTEAVAPTCTQNGNIEYWYCTRCHRYFCDEALTCEISLDDTVIPATGHDYTDAVPTWTWAGYVATANLACNNCHEAQKYAATMSSEVIKQPTCTARGNTLYTAIVTINGKTYRATKLNQIAPLSLGHLPEHHEAHEATCSTTGNIEYWKCTRCGKLFTDEGCTRSVIESKIIIPPTDHNFTDSEPDWEWSEDNKSCNAVFHCNVCDQDVQITATVTGNITQPATCTTVGSTEYTANVSVYGATYYSPTKTDDATPPATGHNYAGVTPTYKWTTSGKTCYAYFTCRTCGAVEKVKCKVTSATTKEATCTAAGKITRTAKITFNGKDYSTTRVDSVAAKGHNYADHLCTVCGAYDLAKPKLTGIKVEATGITVSWGKVSGAYKYQVLRQADGSSKWSKFTTSGTSYKDTTAKVGIIYKYTVRCLNKSGKVVSDYNTTGLRSIILTAPVITTASNTSYNKISWGAVKGATGYRIYRKASNESSYKLLKTISSGSTVYYKDTSAKKGVKYYYYVQAYAKASTTVLSPASNVKTAKRK